MFHLITLFAVTLTSTAEINALSRPDFKSGYVLALTGTVSSVLHGNHFILRDGSGATHLRNLTSAQPTCGQRIAVRGITGVDAYRQEQSHAELIEVLGSESVPPPTPTTVTRIAEGRCNYENVTVEGFVTDVFRDDIDHHWHYLVLEDARSVIYVTIPGMPDSADAFRAAIRRRVRVTGTALLNHSGPRRFIGAHVQAANAAAVEILPASVGASGDGKAFADLTAYDMVHKGANTVTGTVLGSWGGRSVLVEDADFDIHRIDLRDGAKPPDVGALIRAFGLPETDLYRFNLSHAEYAVISAPTGSVPVETELDEKILSRPFQSLQWVFHGQSVRIAGRVLTDATPANGYRAILGFQNWRLAVDVSSVPELADRMPIGAEISASGCGLFDIDNWRPGAAPPALKDMVVVVNRPDGIRVISLPPWWTPVRLLAVILALVVLLVAAAVWNRFLNRLVERRSRQLHREEIGRAAAEFKFQERTRLAVELHDSLSQTLTGIASHIEAASRARQKAPEQVDRHLVFAVQALESCREDLRDCLWDLRSRTLEERDAATAVRRTVQPHAGDCKLAVDMPIDRRTLSDSVFHEILCVLRELVANAVRHGKARQITISGRQSGDTFSFSVTDDGCGFDPERRPGTAEGHFGLQGISERLERLGSGLVLDSAPGRGTIASFSIGTGE